jgi:hypothetical protein
VSIVEVYHQQFEAVAFLCAWGLAMLTGLVFLKPVS